MFIAQFKFPALIIHPARGVEQIILPYYDRIICTEYYIDFITDPSGSVTLYGAYHGEAKIIFSLESVESFQFIDEETKTVIEKWKRHYFTRSKSIWVHDPINDYEKEILSQQCIDY